jgi:hypothetical protein
MLLMFLDRFTKKVYENQLIPSALYSIRLLIIINTFGDLCLFSYDRCATEGTRLFVLLLTAISILGTIRHP